MSDHLEHYGVKGMRWGIRKSERNAKKDAKEAARAKMFYGEGAGTRRKLINEKVASRKKSDPKYAEAFDREYAKQDLGKHGDKAKKERARKDAAKTTKQGAGFVARKITGEWGTTAALTAVTIGAGAAFLKTSKGREILSQAKDFDFSNIRKKRESNLDQELADLLKNAQKKYG